MSISPRASRHGEFLHTCDWQFANLGEPTVNVSIKLITGHGVSLTTRYFAVLGMPLVKRVTRAGPAGKPVIGSEPKLLSEPTFRRIYRGKEDLLIFENRRLRNGMFP